MTNKSLKQVIIVQNRLTHYRVSFFQSLKTWLLTNDITLNLFCGQPSKLDQTRKDEGTLEWAKKCKNFYLSVSSPELIFQLLPVKIFFADLVVLQQENRILSNYAVLLVRKLLNKPTAFWGHAVNFQSGRPQGYREKWKKIWTSKADWFFAYTALSGDVLKSWGQFEKKFTVVNNSIDLQEFK